MLALRTPTDAFAERLASEGLALLRRGPVRRLQLNITRRCSLAGHHCHVESGPKRTEAMSAAEADRALELLARNLQIDVLDLTGGAPELSAHFRHLVRGARAPGRRVIDRCNLTVLFERDQEDTAEFLTAQGVEVRGLPPLLLARERRPAAQPRRLDLVYNPQGPTLPPAQADLEVHYRAELRELFGVEFHRLLTVANMPIRRFA